MNRRTSPENMHAAWHFLERKASGGIACVQEASVPAGVHHSPYTPHFKGCGATIVSYGPALMPESNLGLPTGRGNSCRVKTALSNELLVASLHGAKGKVRGLAGTQMEAYVIWDWLNYELQALLRAAADGRHVVIAGDLNTSTQWNDRSIHGKVAEVFEAYGFKNALVGAASYGGEWGTCACKRPSCEHLPTYRRKYRGQVTWWSIDYIWLSQSLHDRVLSSHVDNAESSTSLALSDHAAVSVDLDV